MCEYPTFLFNASYVSFVNAYRARSIEYNRRRPLGSFEFECVYSEVRDIRIFVEQRRLSCA